MKRGKKHWKYSLAFLLLFLLLSPVFSESETEFTVPVLEPEAIYEMKGQDIMTLYQTVKDVNETKNGYKNLIDETMQISKDAVKLAKEYESENSQLQQQNQKLTLQNNFLIGTTVCSVGIVVAGVITLVVMNIN